MLRQHHNLLFVAAERCEDTAGAMGFREYGSSNGSVVTKIFRHDVMVMMMCAEDETRREERRSGDLGG